MILELQIRIIRAKIFIKINIRKIYYRIRIKLKKEWKTAFRTRFGYYKYIVIPFKFINIPVTIQALINDILKKYLNKFYIVYLDNILIYSNNIEAYKKYVKLVLKIL